MRATGFDGIVFERENLLARTVSSLSGGQESGSELPTPRPPYKAYLCASVTTENESDSKSAYDEIVDNVFRKLRAERRKKVYKAAHLTKQLKEKAADAIPMICDGLADQISELGIYFCYFDRPFISAFGRGRGGRFHPLTFIDNNQDLLIHVCALLYSKRSAIQDERLQMDYFETDSTPAWRELVGLQGAKEIYYSGGECNALISVADNVLRIIDWHQYGWVDAASVLRPIREHLPELSKKLKFYPAGQSNDELKHMVPDIELSAAKEEYLKHPIFFLLWNPAHPRKLSRPSFEWSPPYNATMSKAFDASGCVKTFAGVDEHFYWDKGSDYLVAWSPAERELVAEWKQMLFDLPPVLTEKDLGLGATTQAEDEAPITKEQ